MIKHKAYKYLIYFTAAFMTFYLTQIVILNRLIRVGDFCITGGCVIYFFSPLLADVVAEVYGYNIAKKMLWCGLFGLSFMGVIIFICLRMPSPSYWFQVTEAYNIALGSLPRTIFISCIAIFMGQIVNVFLISKWRIMTRGKYFWLRSVGSSLCGDVITVTLSNAAYFAGKLSVHNLAYLIFPQLVVLILCSAAGAVPASFLSRIVAKSEGLNHYDVGVSFNPFSLKSNEQ